jgi:hypothetical protein
VSALAEALVAAQRRSLATLEKAYVAGAIEAEPMAEAMEACGITDAVDRAFLIASLDVLKEWGVTAPTMTERVARENGEPKKATEGQAKFIMDLLARGNHAALAEQDIRALTFDRASALIDALKAGSYDPAEWDYPF